MLLTKLKIFAALVLTLCFLGSGATVVTYHALAAGQQEASKELAPTSRDRKEAEAKPKEDKELLQGTWVVVAIEIDGNNVPGGQFEEPNTIKWRISGEKISFLSRGDEYPGTFTIDPTKNPKRIEFGHVGEKVARPSRQKGIYHLSGDTLKICYGEPLPTEFKTIPRPKPTTEPRLAQELYVFRREAPAQPPVALPPTSKGAPSKEDPTAKGRTGVEKPDDEMAVAEHIKALHSPDSEKRASAAAALRRIVAKYPSGTVYLPSKDGGEAAWQKKVEQVGAGMAKAEVLKLLPLFKEAPESGGAEEGDSHMVRYRLDYHWVVQVNYRSTRATAGKPATDAVIDRPVLMKSALLVHPAPPKDFTGTWTTWYVNGQKGSEIHYKNGVMVDGDAQKPLDPKVVEAWQKAGAKVGWYQRSIFGSWHFVEEKPKDLVHLPAFGLARFEPGVIVKLPAPSVSFALVFRTEGITELEITDAGLKELVGLKSLQALDLHSSKVTDAGLKELVGFKSLQYLDLGGSQVTDVGLKELAGLKSLQALNLGGVEQVTDVGLKEFAGLKSLQILNLWGTKVTDAGLTELAGLKSLQVLNLAGTQVTDAGLTELADLKGLQILELSSTKVTDGGLKLLAGLENLQNLELTGTKVTDAGLKELAPLKSMQVLGLAGTRVTDAGLKELAGFKSLYSLYLTGPQVTDAGLKELATLKSLRILYLTQTGVTDTGVAQLRKIHPNLVIAGRR